VFRISLPLIVIVLGVIVGIAFSKGKSSAQRGPVIDTTAREAAVRNPGTGHAEPASAPPPPPRAPSAQGGTSLAEYLTRWVAVD
jgi:hypothetical protein